MSVQLYFLMGLVILIDTGLTFVHEVLIHQEFTYFTALHIVSIGLLSYCLFKVATSSREKLSRVLLRSVGTRKRHTENRRLITSVFNHLPCAIAIVSPSYMLVGANEEIQNLTGFKPEHLRGRKCYDVFGLGEICPNCPVREALATKQVCRNFKQELTRTDEEIFIEQTAIPILRKNGTIKYVMEVVLDATRKVHLEQENQAMFVQTVTALANLIESRDPSTARHSSQVKGIALEIGHGLNLMPSELEEIALAASLHDIGKIGIPESILAKPGKLTDEEYDVIKSHPLIGYNALRGVKSLEKIAEYILYHHEMYNGNGYPEKQQGTDIPVVSRILAIADVWEAITSDRVYRPAMNLEQAITIMYEGKGQHFDPEILEVFFAILAEKDEMAAKLVETIRTSHKDN